MAAQESLSIKKIKEDLLKGENFSDPKNRFVFGCWSRCGGEGIGGEAAVGVAGLWVYGPELEVGGE